MAELNAVHSVTGSPSSRYSLHPHPTIACTVAFGVSKPSMVYMVTLGLTSVRRTKALPS